MKKVIFGMVAAVLAVVFLSSLSEQSTAQSGFNTGSYGPRQTLWSATDVLTNLYVSSDATDLQVYSGVSVQFSVVTTQALATVSLKPQWGKMDPTGTNIVWSDEAIVSEAAASGSEIVQTPYSRVISLSLNGTNANYRANYSERFNRLDRYFRVQMKSDVATGTQQVEVNANGLKN